jgi:hypothetical protein
MKKVKRFSRGGGYIDNPNFVANDVGFVQDAVKRRELMLKDNGRLQPLGLNNSTFNEDAAERLKNRGVDLQGVMNNRPGVGMDMGETIPNPRGSNLFSGSGGGGGSKSDDYDYDNAAFKRGGAIKNKAKANVVKKMAKGGSVSSASKRADGCAQRGKTKGRFV